MSANHFLKRELCPSCKSVKYKTIYSCPFLESPIKQYLKSFYSNRIEFEYLNGGIFILNECIDCGLIYQEEIPNDFLMKKLYEEWVTPQIDFHNFDYYSGYAREVMMIIAYFNTMPNQLKFFDFGMGWGKWCLMAKAFGCESYGTELSETKIKHAKYKGINIISWDEIPSYSFDFINTEQVFEHIQEPFETLCHLKKSLKSRGLIKISVPDGYDLKRRLRILDWKATKGSRNSLNVVSPLEHINCFNRKSIIRMADIAGLETVRIPLTIQYECSTYWKFIKPAFKNLLRPLYRDVFKKGTYLFFGKKI